jgi:hypothetical protein
MSSGHPTAVKGRPRLRCRIGLHRWARFKHEDADLENPGAEPVWVTRCRYCGVERGSGISLIAGLAGGLTAAAVLLWWLVSPLLGGVVVIAAFFSLFAVARVISLSRVSGFGFRYRD